MSVAGEPAPAVDAERPVSLLRGLSDSSAFRLLEAAPLATVVSDCSGTIVFVNPRAEALFGYRAGELLGRPVELLVPRRLRDSHTKLRATQDANGSVGPKVGRVLSAERKDGSTFVVEIQLGRAETDEGPLYQAVFIDVSARETGFAAQVARQTALADLGRLGLTAPVQEVLDATVAVVWHHLVVLC